MLSRYSILLYLYARINPAIWDVIVPMGPKYSHGTLNVIGSQVVKFVAQSIKQKALGKSLNAIGRQLYSEGITSMSYDDDNWCGTPPIPFPIHHHIFDIDPASLPWLEHFERDKKLNDRYYGGILSIVSESISNEKIASQLQRIAKQLSKSSR